MKKFSPELSKKVAELVSLISGEENLRCLEFFAVKMCREDWPLDKRWLFVNRAISLIQTGLDVDESLDLATGFAIENTR